MIRRRDIARYCGSTTARLCVNFSAIFIAIGDAKLRCSIVKVALRRALCVNFNTARYSRIRCGDAQISARFLWRYCTRVHAATKVTISFGDTADAAAKPQGRLRFSFGSAAVRKSNAARRCEVAIHAVYITIRSLSALWCLKAFSV